MGKLNIAHHKSYHPYRRDNIEKVRRDEEEAAAKEAREEGRVMLADSEARIDLLRERSGLGRERKRNGKEKEKYGVEDTTGGVNVGTSLTGQGGHINFFEDLEHGQSSFARSINTKKKEPVETEKGVPLAPSAKDLKPWYVGTSSQTPEATDKSSEKEPWEERKKRDRDLAFKALNDPLTSITHQLASRSHSSSSTLPKPQTHLLPRASRSSHPNARPKPNSSDPAPAPTPAPPPLKPLDARLSRESSERERALALIERKKRELRGSETPSTVHGGFGGYGDVFNRVEVEEAHRGQRGWDRGGRQRRW